MKTPHLFVAILACGLLGVSTAVTLAATDYSISTSSGVLTVTNNTNHADNLIFTQPSAGNINFTAPGRTFDNNGAGDTVNNSAAISLSGLTSIVINGGSGGETFSVGGFSGTSFPSLTINGGTGNDTVNFTGNITFASGNNLTVNLQSGTGAHGVDNIKVTGAQLVASDTGAIDLECSQSVAITGGAVVETAHGNLTVMANQQTTPTSGNFKGVTVDGAGTKVQSTGFFSVGTLTVNGRGGDDSGGSQLGVNVNGGGQIIGGFVKVTGTGGASSGIVNRGVTVYGAGSSITATEGGILIVTGTAGAKGSGFGIGVSVLYGGKISGDSTSITGTGGGVSGDLNQGVEIGGAATPASTITSSGSVNITADAGPGASVGLFMSDAAAVGPAPRISLRIDSVSLDNTVGLTATNLSDGIQVSTRSATRIDLGGNNAQGTLGFTTTELARLSGTLLFESGDITLSAPVTRSSAGHLFLYADTGGLHATATGTDVSLANGTFSLNGQGPLNMPITGPAPDTGFPQLNVSGSISLGNNGAVPLNLAGTTFAGTAGQKFTILKNNGAAAISGTFQNLPEGATLPWPGSSLFNAKISYVGGSGHDVVLTLVSATTPTATPTATPSSTPGLVGNVSTRLPVGTGDNVLIEGFIVQGPAGSTKKIIVRAIGPSLAQFGITDALANPTLEIHDASGATIATNDNWKTTQVGGIIAADQATEIAASQLAPSNDLESAIIANLAPGSYTGLVGGANNTIGTGVVDAYDLSPSSAAKLANIATRGLIQPGDKLMIAGFIVQNAPVQTVVRAIGPSLVPFGIPNALPDTTLQLRDQNGTIVVQNDDWKVRTDGSSQQAELEATGLQPSNDLEAAFLITLQPGQYTAQVRGKPEQTGIGVVQVYFLQ